MNSPRKISNGFRTVAILAATVMFAQAGEVQPPKGFEALFNGRDLSGWHGNNPHTTARAKVPREEAIAQQQEEFKQHWTVEDGELVNDGKGPYATTDKDYGDIEFLIEYKTVAKADSGIYLRGTPQVQIWDTTKEGGKQGKPRFADKGSGGLFNNTKGAPGQLPLVHADKPFGEWNSFRIVQVGSRTTVDFNDRLVVDNAIMENYWDKTRQTPLPATGPIHLQTHGGEIRWRNIFVRGIPAEEANRILRQGDQGFTPLFNGRDLAGWAGATDSYEVKDGAIVCKPGEGGNLFTQEEYGDFVARLEFKLPPGGNNGLAIRFPGQGRPAYDGMCELQIADNSHPKYAKLDPRQFHGSAYGMVAAQRGYLRPVGEWNYQEVTVKGSTIRVELNGTVILDADLSKVTEFHGDRPHPGKDLEKGHFGFAGHKDPVMFRNIAIKRLAPDKEKWVSLFDGKTLNGFEAKGGFATYRVEDGAIVGRTADGSKNTFLSTVKDYSDFELELEVKCDPELNSGIQIRSHTYAEDTPQASRPKRNREKGEVYGYQCEITTQSKGTSGNFWDEGRWTKWHDELSEDAKKAFKDGEWNKYRIVAKGSHIRSWVNGVPCADFKDDLDATGFIGLQVHGIKKGAGPYEVRWRNLRIRELK